jgi:peptidoglycan/xylan/chitin deacetylase (PgdA/CDA1 family)
MRHVDCISRTQLFEDLHKLLLPLAPQVQRIVLDQLPDVPPRSTHRCMTAEELTLIAQGGLVDLGAHTVAHRSLAHATPEEQRQELDGSKTFLENLLGHPVLDFSYPYGMTSTESQCTRGRFPIRGHNR